MQYLIARDGRQLGQFEEEEIRTGLFEGRYLPSDAAWTEGMQDWRPIGEILGQGVARAAERIQKGIASAPSRSTPTKAAGIALAALALVGVAVAAAISVGAIGGMKEKKQLTEGITAARNLVLAVRLYAADNGGKYPATLDELGATGKITAEALEQARNFKPDKWLGEAGFEFLGADLNDSTEGGKPLVKSRCWDSRGRRIVGTNDTSVALYKEPPR